MDELEDMMEMLHLQVNLENLAEESCTIADLAADISTAITHMNSHPMTTEGGDLLRKLNHLRTVLSDAWYTIDELMEVVNDKC